MTLSKIYTERLEQLNEELDASIDRKIKHGNEDYLFGKGLDEIRFLYTFVSNPHNERNLSIQDKIALLKQLEEL